MSLSEIITMLLPLLGVIIGGAITYFTQNNIENKKIKKELKEKEEIRNIEKLQIYSAILKTNGEVLTYTYLGQDHYTFHVDVFKNIFRPILFSKFYLLNQDIIENIKKMDKIIIHAEHRENLSDKGISMEESKELVDLFDLIINKIESKLKEFQ